MPNGWVQDWRQGGTRHQWKANGRKLNHEERERADAEMKTAKAEREAGKAERQVNAAAEAERIWNAGHQQGKITLTWCLKGVKPHGIGQRGNELLIPIWHDGKLVSLQRIFWNAKNEKWEKRFLKGTSKHYYVIGEIEHADKVCIAEGFATAATIYEATGIACVVAFDAGNLLPVAKALELSLSGVGFIICADDDWKRLNPQTGEPENIGMLKAREVARHGAKPAVPSLARTEGKRKPILRLLVALGNLKAARLYGARLSSLPRTRRKKPISFAR